MATIEGIAPIIRAALASFEAEFPSHVAVFNAEPANAGAQLEDPKEYAFGAADPLGALGYPVVEVSSLEGSLGPFSTGTGGVGDADSDPRLNVVVWLEGSTGEVRDLYEKGLGYIRCVIEIGCEEGALGDNAEVSGSQERAIEWSIDPIPGGPANVDRELRRWKLPCAVSFAIEAIERWQ